MQKVLEINGEFTKVTGLTLNYNKCSSYATTSNKMHPLISGGYKLPVTSVAKALGVSISVNESAAESRAIRVKNAEQVADRLAFAPLPFEARVQLTSSLILPRGLYECTAAPMPPRLQQTFTNAVLRGILGNKRGRYCAEVVFTLLAPGHRVDPGQAVAYQSLVTMQRVIRKRADLYHELCATWLALSRPRAASDGPMQVVRDSLDLMGAEWVSPFVVKFECGRRVDLVDLDPGEWSHLVRESLRMATWRRAAERRPDMDGLERGVDREVS